MEPSVFLFFFRAVFKQFHTYVIVGEGSFSSLGEATASLTPPATASGRISFTPSHCSISEGSCPARLPPHSLTFSTLSSPFSNDRFLPAVLLTLDLQQQWCKQTSQRLTNLVMGLGDSMLFGKSFLILLLEHCCESHVTLYFRKICGGKEIQHFLFWLKISYKYLQSQLLCQVLGFGKKPQIIGTEIKSSQQYIVAFIFLTPKVCLPLYRNIIQFIYLSQHYPHTIQPSKLLIKYNTLTDLF